MCGLTDGWRAPGLPIAQPRVSRSAVSLTLSVPQAHSVSVGEVSDRVNASLW